MFAKQHLNTITLRWSNPTQNTFAGILIRRSFVDYLGDDPTNGDFVASGNLGTSYNDTVPTESEIVYYSIFAHDTSV
jgi:hypothetical protein